MKRAYPVVVKRGRRRFSAFAPDVAGAFVVERTIEDALRRVRETIAESLRLMGELGEELPEPDPAVARALARVTDPNAGLPTDPSVQVRSVEVEPEDASPDAPADEPSPAATDRREARQETFVAVVKKTPDGYSGQAPDLPVCIAVGETVDETRSNMAEAIALHVQDMVDDGDPLPERRLTPAEALAQRSEERERESADGNRGAFAELVTVEVQPPLPQARRLDAIWQQARRNEAAFEADCTIQAPLAAGESWSGAYAADLLHVDSVWYGRIAEWQNAVETGKTREELRRNLQAAVTRALLESLAEDGTIPLPRRTAESATAERYLRAAASGDDEYPAPDETVEMIPVEIEAPRIACAS